MTRIKYNHRSLFLLDSIQQLMRAVSGERLAFQAGTEEFEPPSPLQIVYISSSCDIMQLLTEKNNEEIHYRNVVGSFYASQCIRPF